MTDSMQINISDKAIDPVYILLLSMPKFKMINQLSPKKINQSSSRVKETTKKNKNPKNSKPFDDNGILTTSKEISKENKK